MRRIADHVAEVARLPDRRPAVHERLRPPHAPTLARPGRRRGQRPPGRLRLRGRPRSRDYLAGRAHRRAWRCGRASCAPGFRANVLMGVTSNRVDVKRAGGVDRARARAPRRAPRRPLRAARRVARTVCSSWRGSRWCATRPTTRSAPARSTTWSTRCCTASPRRRRSREGLAERGARDLRPLAGRARSRRCVNPSAARPVGRRRAAWCRRPARAGRRPGPARERVRAARDR